MQIKSIKTQNQDQRIQILSQMEADVSILIKIKTLT